MYKLIRFKETCVTQKFNTIFFQLHGHSFYLFFHHKNKFIQCVFFFCCIHIWLFFNVMFHNLSIPLLDLTEEKRKKKKKRKQSTDGCRQRWRAPKYYWNTCGKEYCAHLLFIVVELSRSLQQKTLNTLNISNNLHVFIVWTSERQVQVLAVCNMFNFWYKFLNENW